MEHPPLSLNNHSLMPLTNTFSLANKNGKIMERLLLDNLIQFQHISLTFMELHLEKCKLNKYAKVFFSEQSEWPMMDTEDLKKHSKNHGVTMQRKRLLQELFPKCAMGWQPEPSDYSNDAVKYLIYNIYEYYNLVYVCSKINIINI